MHGPQPHGQNGGREDSPLSGMRLTELVQEVQERLHASGHTALERIPLGARDRALEGRHLEVLLDIDREMVRDVPGSPRPHPFSTPTFPTRPAMPPPR
jgi:hypothetical protein